MLSVAQIKWHVLQEALGRARKSVKPEDIEQYKSFAKNLKVKLACLSAAESST